MEDVWNRIRLNGYETRLYELFHENSKTPRFDPSLPSDADVVRHMAAMWDSVPYRLYPSFDLPRELSGLKLSLEDAMMTRVTARSMRPVNLGLRDLATLLHYAYGVTRDNVGTAWPRPFRTVPSGGALYPLEIYFHSRHIVGLDGGLYHYYPPDHSVALLAAGDLVSDIAPCLVQQNIGHDATVIFFITAMFERSAFKYGDRGYRFVLLEAGHVAQNMNLVANGLGLASINIGGFFDRSVDNLLGLDGVTHSTVYLVAIGGAAE